MKRILALCSILLSVTLLSLAGCASQDRLDLPGDARTIADFQEDFPEIDVSPLEDAAESGDLRFVEYGDGWNLMAQQGDASTDLFEWYTESQDRQHSLHQWYAYKGVDRDIWMKSTYTGKLTIVTVTTKEP